jgi:two-component system CheB/CheR fusion protein
MEIKTPERLPQQTDEDQLNEDSSLNEITSSEANGEFEDFIIAVGASAGGLEALERFFNECPNDSGAAFVVIQHLSPDHKSMMHDLLGRHTRMPVKMVADGMKVERDHVFLIPAGTIMRINKGQFQLTPKSPHMLTLPIDIFLRSLADDFGARSVACILSGTGSDGTRGATAINAAGGFLLAQDPQDAKFDGMHHASRRNPYSGSGLAASASGRSNAHQTSSDLTAHELSPGSPLSGDLPGPD